MLTHRSQPQHLNEVSAELDLHPQNPLPGLFERHGLEIGEMEGMKLCLSALGGIGGAQMDFGS